MKNFKIIDKTTEKEYWISRSVAVAIIVYYEDINENIYVLLEKRGKGCPDFIGYYCLPCGYVDWDETLEQAARRELYEETGLKLDKQYLFNIISIQDNPKDNIRQNITIRFAVNVPSNKLLDALVSGEMNINTKDRGGEANEVENFKFISVNEIDNYDLAWNHNEVIKTWYENRK